MSILQWKLFKQAWLRIKETVQEHKFSNNDINQFILLLRKGVCSDEYINELKKINETSLPAYYCYYLCRLHAYKKSL